MEAEGKSIVQLDLEEFLQQQDQTEEYVRNFAQKVAELVTPHEGKYLGVNQISVKRQWVSFLMHFTGVEMPTEPKRTGVPDHHCMGCIPLCVPLSRIWETVCDKTNPTSFGDD